MSSEQCEADDEGDGEVGCVPGGEFGWHGVEDREVGEVERRDHRQHRQILTCTVQHRFTVVASVLSIRLNWPSYVMG